LPTLLPPLFVITNVQQSSFPFRSLYFFRRVCKRCRSCLQTAAVKVFVLEMLVKAFVGKVCRWRLTSCYQIFSVVKIYQIVLADCSSYDASQCNYDSSRDSTCSEHVCSFNASGAESSLVHKCPCSKGFELKNDQCEDVDECLHVALNLCDLYANCSNLNGSYLCDCNAGFSGNGITCEGEI